MQNKRSKPNIYRKFSIFLESRQKSIDQKLRTESKSSLVYPNYSYLPLLRIEKKESLPNAFAIGSPKHINIISSGNLNHFTTQSKNFLKQMANMSIKKLCDFDINRNLRKNETSNNDFEKIKHTLNNNKSKKKMKNILEKFDFTNTKPEFNKKIVFNDNPARFRYLPEIKQIFLHKKTEIKEKENGKTMNSLITANSLLANKSLYEKRRSNFTIPDFLPTENSEEAQNNHSKPKNSIKISPFLPTYQNIMDEEENLLKKEEDGLNSKQYLEIASDFQVKKHTTFEQIRRSLLRSLNMIFELKLNLKDVIFKLQAL